MRALCVLLLVGLVAAQEKRDVIMGLPGGIYQGDLSSPEAQEAVKQALVEFRHRAVNSGQLAAGSVILVGEVVDVKEQVVAGQKYIITINLGVTSDAGCAADAENGFVSAAVCSNTEDLGLHKVEVISQPWMPVKYIFGEFQDVSGPELAAYWN